MTETCGAKTRAGTPCQRPSGWGTAHVGTGRCKLHGGNAGAPIRTGARAVKTSRQLRDKIQRHIKDTNPLDLTEELALLRALIDHFREKLDEAEADPTREDAGTFLLLVQGVQKVADTISKIQSRELLTAGEMMLLLATLATVLREEVTDGQVLRRITGKLRSRLQLPQLAGGADILGEGD